MVSDMLSLADHCKKELERPYNGAPAYSQYLRTRCRQLNMDYNQFAREIGVVKSTASVWINAKVPEDMPSLKWRMKIEAFFLRRAKTCKEQANK